MPLHKSSGRQSVVTHVTYPPFWASSTMAFVASPSAYGPNKQNRPITKPNKTNPTIAPHPKPNQKLHTTRTIVVILNHLDVLRYNSPCVKFNARSTRGACRIQRRPNRTHPRAPAASEQGQTEPTKPNHPTSPHPKPIRTFLVILTLFDVPRYSSSSVKFNVCSTGGACGIPLEGELADAALAGTPPLDIPGIDIPAKPPPAPMGEPPMRMPFMPRIEKLLKPSPPVDKKKGEEEAWRTTTTGGGELPGVRGDWRRLEGGGRRGGGGGGGLVKARRRAVM